MLLPIAIIYNDLGMAVSARYLKFDVVGANNPELEYKQFNEMLGIDIQKGICNTQVVELPLDNYNVSVDAVSSYGYVFKNIKELSPVQDNMLIGREFVQVISNKNHFSWLDYPEKSKRRYKEILYAVDYTGKIFPLTPAQLFELDAQKTIRWGNIDVSVTMADTIFCSSCDFIVHILEPSYNKYASSLVTQVEMQGKALNSANYFTLDDVQDAGTVILVPKGIYNININPLDEGKCKRLKSIILPQIARMVFIKLPILNLETIKLPEVITDALVLDINSVKNLILPKKLVPNTTVKTDKLFLRLGTIDLQELKLPDSVVCNTKIIINNAPNLQSITQRVAVPVRYNNTSYLIIIDNCPKLKYFRLPTFEPVFRRQFAFSSVTLAIDSPEYTCEVRAGVNTLVIAFSEIAENHIVHIRHKGINTLRITYRGAEQWCTEVKLGALGEVSAKHTERTTSDGLNKVICDYIED